MFGLTREEFMGRTAYHVEWKVINDKGILLKPEEHPSMIALSSGRPVTDKVIGVFNQKNESYTWMIVNAVPKFKEKEKKPYEVAVTMLDITEKKKTEDALAESESILRIIHENITDIVWSIDTETKITYISPSVKRILGYDVDYLIGKSILQFIAKEYHESAAENIRHRINQKNENSLSYFEYEMVAAERHEDPY